MRCGLFGKLPSKRDFIAYEVPRDFLNFWETWLQSSVSASKVTLGDNWQSSFLTAPIWRFWLGSGFCGVSAMGAMMPSVDGIGRYFPLTILACATADAALDPPIADEQDDWFAKVEQSLLSALEESFAGDPAGLVDDLAYPRFRSQSEIPEALDATSQFWPVPLADFAQVFAAMRASDHDRQCRNRSYWWTGGGSGQPAQILVFEQMPDPYQFSGFLTGFNHQEGVS